MILECLFVFSHLIFPFDKGVGAPYIFSDRFMPFTVIPQSVIKLFYMYDIKVDVGGVGNMPVGYVQGRPLPLFPLIRSLAAGVV